MAASMRHARAAGDGRIDFIAQQYCRVGFNKNARPSPVDIKICSALLRDVGGISSRSRAANTAVSRRQILHWSPAYRRHYKDTTVPLLPFPQEVRARLHVFVAHGCLPRLRLPRQVVVPLAVIGVQSHGNTTSTRIGFFPQLSSLSDAEITRIL